MIKIGVDGRLLHGKLTGVGKYVLNLLTYLCEQNDQIKISVYSNRQLEISLNANYFSVIYDNGLMARIKPMVWSKFLSYRLINVDKPDIYFAGDAFVPAFISTKNILSVVHDLNAIIAPETMSRLRLITDKLFFKKDIAKAKVVITNSFGTAQKLEQYHHITTDLVIHPVLDNGYNILDADLVKSRLLDIGIDYPFILTVSTQEPRKNMDKTIKAFVNLKNDGKLTGYKLLLAGAKGWNADYIQKLVAQNKDDVISLGYVSDEIMPYLYNGASVFVFPSSYEGFGMPAREAMLCGTTVVASDIPELKEATFQQGYYINPNNLKEFIALIEKAVKNSKVVKRNSLNDSDQLPELMSVIKDMLL